jgi:arylsulfatase A
MRIIIPKICFSLLAVLLTGKTYAQQQRPNIVFILADDLGYADIGCYGQQKIQTPHIDALARSGMKCTQYYSGSTVCAPARASFMTGLHTGHSPIRGNRGTQPEGQFPLPANALTFPMLLQQQGYYTAAFGKWGMGYIETTGDPQKKGFHDFFGYNCQSLAHSYYPDHLWDGHARINYPENPYRFTNYSADIIHTKAMNTIRAQKADKPFFIFLPYTIPHSELTVPHDSVYERYVKLFNEPALRITNKRDTAAKPFEPYPHAAFAAMVSRLDKYVGEVVALLKEKKLLENTLIIFTSDNGPHKEGGGDPVFFNNTAGLRGIKRDLYEGGIRDPMILSWKGRIRPGVINEQPFAMWDFFPSFLELAGAKPPAGIDGRSLLPMLFKNKKLAREYFYWELEEAGGKQAVRWGKWKGIKNGLTNNPDAALELYDLNADPFEKNNIASQHPAIVTQIEKYMREAHVPNKDWPLFKSEK